MNDNEERVEIPCPVCHGAGAVEARKDDRFVITECSHCDGEGWIQE